MGKMKKGKCDKTSKYATHAFTGADEEKIMGEIRYFLKK